VVKNYVFHFMNEQGISTDLGQEVQFLKEILTCERHSCLVAYLMHNVKYASYLPTNSLKLKSTKLLTQKQLSCSTREKKTSSKKNKQWSKLLKTNCVGVD
jgi:hypothetical protein